MCSGLNENGSYRLIYLDVWFPGRDCLERMGRCVIEDDL